MHKLFIYYSLSGNGDIVSEYLKEKHITLRKVTPKKALPKNMVMRILTGGFLAGINHCDELIDFDSNIKDYDDIIIGTPIWNDHVSCPINTVLNTLDLSDKKLTFILYSGSGSAPKTEKYLSIKYPESRIINIKEPSKNNNLSELLSNI